MMCPVRDLLPGAPCRWEWICKYLRTVLIVLVCFDLSVLSSLDIPQRDNVQQPYCWNEYEDVASRAYISPVVVKARCVVVYSRGSFSQFNATFHVTKVLKGKSVYSKGLERNPRIQLHFGITEAWTKFPATSSEILQEGLLRNQICLVPRVDIQKEYILFLQPHNDDLDLQLESTNEVLDNLDNGADYATGTTWSIYAAPEVFSDSAVSAIQKVAKRAKFPSVAPLRSATLSEGDEVSLRCRVKGYPHPKILWYKDGVNLDHQKRKGLVVRNRRRVNRLRIKKSRSEDTGRYKCVAVNVVGSAESEAVITIAPAPTRSSLDLNMAAEKDDHWIFKGVRCLERNFCLNGGSCTLYLRINARSCNCSVGFEGPRCEMSSVSHTQVGTEPLRERQLNANIFEIFTGTTAVLTLILLILLIILCYYGYRKLRKGNHTCSHCATSSASSTISNGPRVKRKCFGRSHTKTKHEPAQIRQFSALSPVQKSQGVDHWKGSFADLPVESTDSWAPMTAPTS